LGVDFEEGALVLVANLGVSPDMLVGVLPFDVGHVLAVDEEVHFGLKENAQSRFPSDLQYSKDTKSRRLQVK